MSRTPLFDLVRRSTRLADVANCSVVPANELVDQFNERQAMAHAPSALTATCSSSLGSHRVSRRSFMQSSAAIVSAAALSRKLHAQQPARLRARQNPAEYSVLIIGAGIAGLSAAYRLQQAGVRVRIVEGGCETGQQAAREVPA